MKTKKILVPLFKRTVTGTIFIPEYAPNQCFYYSSILVFPILVRKFCSNPKFSKYFPLKLGMDFLVVRITFSMDCLVALNTIA